MLLFIHTLFFQLLLNFPFFLTDGPKSEVITSFKDIHSYSDIKSKRAFSFSVISDDHGETPLTDVHAAMTVKWIKEDQSKFVLGMGDIDVNYTEDKVMSHMIRSEWWMNNFYPTIGDTEDQYFLDDPNDVTYKSPQLYLKVLKINQRENVKMSPGGKQYYAKITHEGINIYFISLYYTDVHHGDRDLFPPESKEFLINSLNEIEKNANDIIIVGAHTEYGTFIEELDPEAKKLVYDKCDLLLSGGVHYFERHRISKFQNTGPLNLSCGSMTKARWGAPNGFLQIHVMKDPLSLVIQYLDVSKPELQLVDTPYSYLKLVNGNKYMLSLVDK